jgi:hypothetical protein
MDKHDIIVFVTSKDFIATGVFVGIILCLIGVAMWVAS